MCFKESWLLTKQQNIIVSTTTGICIPIVLFPLVISNQFLYCYYYLYIRRHTTYINQTTNKINPDNKNNPPPQTHK